jgi:UDP-N-acetylmuramoyl-tripeptide--D-alanyl-D-alanine ligase
MGGVLLSGDPAAAFSGAALDSRKVTGGELFFALRGTAADGHDFVAGALARGAAAAVVDHPAAPGALIQVPAVYDALHALTRAVRRQVPRQGLVGITGSTGKTTTKELVAVVLAHRFEVAKSPGNLNNLLGFPLALLGTADSCEWLVAELGMSTPGELAQISALARPDIAVYTNVRAVHLEFFASVGAIAEAKAELLDGLAPGGTIVANADDPEVMRIVTRHQRERDPRCRILGYGIESPDAEVTATAVEPLGGGLGSRFVLVSGGVPGPTVELPLLGRHNVENALAAAAVGLALGVAPAAIAAALGTARPAPMRGEVLHLADGVTVIDDCYNSNPAALDRALEAGAAIPAARHWAVIGDMRELGPTAPAFHRAAGSAAVRHGFGPLVAVGAHAKDVLAGAREVAPQLAGHAFANAAEAAAVVAALLLPGDLVLVKGSRGVGLERVVDAFRAAAAGRRAGD